MEHPKAIGDRTTLADPNSGTPSRHYLGEIDYFAVHCPETGGVYLIPINDIAVRHQGALRVEPTRNGQRRRIRSAAAYEIARVSVGPTAEPGASSGAAGSCA